MKRQRYAPIGALALNPKAFGQVFDLPDDDEDGGALPDNGVAVVTIRGPLMNHAEWFFDSYESIKNRVREALELRPKMVVLSIDSPGGLVSGAFDTARELRAMAEASSVDLFAHVEGQATSAAYALASSASWIGVSRSAMLGSIGVIDMMVDATAQNQMMGLDVQLVTSGERKADGNPNAAISEQALGASQTRVDKLAEMFFSLVVEHGWGGSVDALRSMQAGIVTGDDAVKVGLATQVATLEQTIAFAKPATMRDGSGAESTEGKYTMATTPMDDAVASLRKAAEGEDEDEARKARAALKALGVEDDEDDSAEGEDNEESQDDDDPPEAQDDDDDDSASAQDDDDDASAQDDDDDAQAAAGADANAIAAMALAEVHKIKHARKAEKTARERKRLLASRPDFAPELIKVLRSAPMATVRDMCKTLPRGPARVERTAAAATATGTRGKSQGDDRAPRLAPEQKAALDAQMGLTETQAAVVNSPNRMSFGVRVPIAQKGK